MTNWTPTELAALRRLIAKAESDPDFTADDITNLRQLADAFRGWQYLGRFTKWLIFLLAALAGAIAAYETITTKVRTWLGA